MHANELWRQNLLSFYREIPINRLLIGDCGCDRHLLTVALEFPRVHVFDHRQYVSLGYSLRKLIEAVQTEWFVYLHSDVYLPQDWFAHISSHRESLDWIECRPVLTTMVEIPLDHSRVHRPFSGAQLGRTSTFFGFLPKIEDDYLYRNEDIVLAELLKDAGGKYSRVYDVFHYHQEMAKPSPWERRVESVKFAWQMDKAEQERAYTMQIKGLVKYLKPRDDMPLDHYDMLNAFRGLEQINADQAKAIWRWIALQDPAWARWCLKQVRKERREKLISSLQITWSALRDYIKALIKRVEHAS